ncbi:hypothetical protein [Solimonas variicoloris]|uniref:hypothetical protein n=1 Tax=Solimonas variicoloris TaxID=254408 RepID=UPI00036FB688|nr:hypothetical protein [Solimonas variicoloris]
MSTLRTRAELQRLARLLDVPGERLHALAAVGHGPLAQLRERATAMLYDADREHLQRIAAATRLLPAAIAALIAEKSLGPLLCARIAGLLPADTALDIARRLPDAFLADLCLELDPRRARAVVERMPIERCVAVSLELARRGEYVTMGRFVDILGLDALLATVARLTDDAVLLKVAFYAEDRTRLDRVIERLPEARFGGIIDAALDGGGELWPEALSLIAELEPRWRRKFGELALSRAEASIRQIVQLSDAHQLWPALLPVADSIDEPEAVRRLHAALLVQDIALLERMAAAARHSPMYARLAELDWPAPLRAVIVAPA